MKMRIGEIVTFVSSKTGPVRDSPSPPHPEEGAERARLEGLGGLMVRDAPKALLTMRPREVSSVFARFGRAIAVGLLLLLVASNLPALAQDGPKLAAAAK